MNPLERQKIQDLRQYLTWLENFGFASLSSPTVVLLESAIDLSLALRDAYASEDRPKLGLNPTIGFSQKVDDLGNQKSFKIFKDQKGYSDPESEEFFNSLAEFFVLVKRHRPIKASFAEAFSTYLSSPLEGEDRTNSERTRTKVKISSYHRRQRKRNS